jgi:hypothetical protein
LGAFVRTVASIMLSCVALLSSGCTVWQQETTNRGGYVDYVLDQHWIKADSKRMRALRAFAIQVSLARIASISAKNDSDRQLLAIRLGALTKQFQPVYACAIKRDPTNVPGSEMDPCFYYDSAMVQYSTGLFDLAMAALPIDDAKSLANAVVGSSLSAINFPDLLNALVVVGRDALTYGRVVGALYRDTIELEVQLYLATPAIDDRPPPYRITETDVAGLRAVYAQGNDDMPGWLAQLAALREKGLEPLPDPRFFVELGGLMKYICDLITQDATASSSCKANLPTTMAAPTPALASAAPVHVAAVVQAPPPAQPVKTTVNVPAPSQLGTDPERQILKTYLAVGSNAFDPTRAQNLQQLLSVPAIQAALAQIQGAGAPALLPDIVEKSQYAPVRKLMVAEARQRGWIQ